MVVFLDFFTLEKPGMPPLQRTSTLPLLSLFSLKFYNVRFLGHKIWPWDWTNYKAGGVLTYSMQLALLLPTWLISCCTIISCVNHWFMLVVSAQKHLFREAMAGKKC